MKSFKTIKIVILAGLMASTAMPVEAGMLGLIHKVESGLGKFGHRLISIVKNPYIAAWAGTTALGAGIGYGIAKYQKKTRKYEFNRVLGCIKTNASTSIAIDQETVKKIGTIKAVSKTHERALIGAINTYNESLRTDKGIAEAKAYLIKLAGELENKCILPDTADIAYGGALMGYTAGFLAILSHSYFSKR